MYQRNLSHSSEGSTWTKKNHKYIRKEGNRYIYPEDVNKTPKARKLVDTITDTSGNKVPIRGAAATKTIANRSNRYDKVSGERLSASEVRRRNATNSQGTTDYKRLSEQKANRSAAANGKVINPIATWRGSDGKVLARVKTNEKVSMPTTSDYKKYGQLRGGEANRSKTVNKQGSQSGQEYAKQRSKDYADQQKEIRELERMERQDQNRKYPGSGSKGYEDAKKQKRSIDIAKKAVNEYEKNKDVRSNEYARQIKGSKEYQQEVAANSRSSKPTVNNAKSVETWDNSKNIKSWDSETVKKSTKGQKGHFTVQDGKTTFVSDDDATNKRVSKGKQIVDKIKGLFNKNGESKQLKQLKKDRKKGLLSTREYRHYKDNGNYDSVKTEQYKTIDQARKADKKAKNKDINDSTWRIANPYDKINNPMGKPLVQRNSKGVGQHTIRESLTDNPYDYYNRKAENVHRRKLDSFADNTPSYREERINEDKRREIGEKARRKREKK